MTRRFQRGVEPGAGILDKTSDGGFVADEVELAAPFRKDFLGLDAPLGEDRAVLLRLGRVGHGLLEAPDGVRRGGGDFGEKAKVAEVVEEADGLGEVPV